MAHRTRSAAVLAGSLLAACQSPPPADDAGAATLDLGTGGIGVFEPISDGDTVLLARGCQGRQHVWISLRAGGIDTSPALVELIALRESDLARASRPFLVRLTFERVSGTRQLSGLSLVVPDPSMIVGQGAILRARVSEATPGGTSVETERRVRVEWGTEVCSRVPPDGSVGDAGSADAAGDAMSDAGAAPDAAPIDTGP